MSIRVLEERVFVLETKCVTYSFCVDSRGILRHLYFGKKIERAEDFLAVDEGSKSGHYLYVDAAMEELSSFGMTHYRETGLKVAFSDGTKDFRYRVSGYEAEENKLAVTLQDIYYPFEIVLCYQVYEEEDMIGRFTSAVNKGDSDILIERMHSVELGIPGRGMKILNYTGSWAAEFQKRAGALEGGKRVYESVRGNVDYGANPSFMVYREACEDFGEVWFGALEYSGNYKVCAEEVSTGYTNVLMGINDTDFTKRLKAGESFDSPTAYLGYTGDGFCGMSHQMHEFCRRRLMPDNYAKKPLRVLYNSWYATMFDVKCEEQKRLAEKAAKLGAELFVIDDGWFGERDDDRHSLGDWYVDRQKFPNGLQELISYVNELGMDFGIWIEPEMVNENSALYRKHPDWVYRFVHREVVQGRNQYALNLGKEEVVQFIIETFDKLLSENNISYIKWDMNRMLAETGTWDGDSSCCEGDFAGQKEIWIKHTRNLYRIVKTVREKYPWVEFEACAGGGARIGLGAMRYFDEYWTSDNTDALDRLEIQNGYSLLYPVKYMRAWVTDVPDGLTGRSTPLSFRIHCAMCGAFGIGNNLNRLGETELAVLKKGVSDYKRVRDTVQFGELYRLGDMEKDGYFGVQYVKDEKSVIFTFLPQCRFGEKDYRFCLKGLKENELYQVRTEEEEQIKSGAFLMHYGILVHMWGDYDSKMIEIEKCR